MSARTGSVLVAVAAVGAGLLTACGTGDERARTSGATTDNCGVAVGTDSPPERVYAAYQPAIEIMHALGLEDRVVGTGLLDAAVLPEFAAAQAELEYTPRLPSRDGLLAANPDFVLSGFNGVFAADGDGTSFGTRASLAEVGVDSWILSPLCPSEDGRTDEAIDPSTVDLDTLHDDVLALGALFDVEERAEEVVADQVARVEAVRERVEDRVGGGDRPTVAFLTVGDDGGLRTAGGIDFGTRIVEAAGGENVFADLTESRNVDVDVEEVVRRDPDVILTSSCCDASLTVQGAEPDAQRIRDLEALAGVAAVEQDRVHAFLFADRSAGLRVAHAVELLAELLHPRG